MVSKIDPGALKRVFAHYPAGVAAIAAKVGGDDHVLVASSFMPGISLDPPLVSVAVQSASTTWPSLRKARRIGVSLLGQGQEGLCRQLASKDRQARWNGVTRSYVEDAAVRIHGACAWLNCIPYAEHDAGDHVIALLEVVDYELIQSVDPLIFHGSRFRGFSPEPAARSEVAA